MPYASNNGGAKTSMAEYAVSCAQAAGKSFTANELCQWKVCYIITLEAYYWYLFRSSKGF